MEIEEKLVEGPYAENYWRTNEYTGNVVKGFGDYYISYNDFSTPHPMMAIVEAVFGKDEEETVMEPETALCKEDQCYILNGDHRDAYDKFSSWEECMGYFNEHKVEVAE